MAIRSLTLNFEEMLEILKDTARVNRAIAHRTIAAQINPTLDEGADLGEIKTGVDVNTSRALLYGQGVYGITPFCQRYPGSFSEEEDSPLRYDAKEALMADPFDGTGDYKRTYQTSRIIHPTTLVTKIVRDSVLEPFRPISAFILDIIDEIALVSDGNYLGLFSINTEGDVVEIPCKRIQPPEWKIGDPIFINRRVSFPQVSFDVQFVQKFLPKQGFSTKQVHIGGAGLSGLQFFRNYLEPLDSRGDPFRQLKPLTILFNCQPDWKTWDVDPSRVFAQALGLSPCTDIYGKHLYANPAVIHIRDMWHLNGCVFSTSGHLQEHLCELAEEFEERNPDCKLTNKDYEYADAIIALARGE